jgi:hypothetical protein
VSATESVIQSRPFSRPCLVVIVTVPFFVAWLHDEIRRDRNVDGDHKASRRRRPPGRSATRTRCH